MTQLDIANNLTLAMIEHHGITLFTTRETDNQILTAENNAKAVAAAFEIIYAGVLETTKKDRR